MIRALLLTIALLLPATGLAQRVPGPETVRFVFPCEAKAVTRIWVDDEIFWDSEAHGLMLLESCDTLEIHVDWYESIVLEWLATNSAGRPVAMRMRLFPNGTMVPEHKVPESQRLDV